MERIEPTHVSEVDGTTYAIYDDFDEVRQMIELSAELELRIEEIAKHIELNKLDVTRVKSWLYSIYSLAYDQKTII